MLINKLWDLLTSTLLVEMKEPQLHFFFLENISFQKTKNAWSYIRHKNQ